MRRTILWALVLVVALHAPWRLLALAGETFLLSPSLTRTQQGDELYWEARALEDRLNTLGWSVTYRVGLNAYGNAAYGVTDPREHAIYIDEDLHWNARYAVLAHEGGHVLQPFWVSRPQGEAFAEAVAALVTHDGIREHARYLASIRWDALMLLVTEWRSIERAAAVLQ